MATIVTRAGKGSPLTNTEVDANFTNINTELGTKANSSALASYLPLTGGIVGGQLESGDLLVKYNSATTWTNRLVAPWDQPAEVLNMNESGISAITFHVVNKYANLFGYDENNVLKSNNNTIWHSGNFTPANYLPLTGGTVSGILNTTASGVFTSHVGYNPATNVERYTLGGFDALQYGMSVGEFGGNGNGLRTNLAGYYGVTIGTQGSTRLTVDSTGNVTAAVEMRAPIFRDSDNGAFYVDPASGTNLNGPFVTNGGPAMSGGWNRTATLQATYPVLVFNSNGAKYSGIGVDHSVAAGGMRFFVNASTSDVIAGTTAMNINTGNFVEATGEFRAPLFRDNNNSAYYVDPDDATLLSSVRARGQIRATGWWGSYSAGVNSLGVEIGQTSGRGYILSYNRDATAYGPLSLDATDFQFSAYSGGYAHVNTSFRAPVFYDSDNAAYYVDPAGTSNLGQINFGDSSKFIRGGASGQTILGVGDVNSAFLQVGSSYYSIWNAGNFDPSTKQNSLGYAPVNRAGDTMTGTLAMNGSPIVMSANGSLPFIQFEQSNVVAGRNYRIRSGIEGVANGGFSIRDLTAGTNVLSIDENGLLTASGGRVFRSSWTSSFMSGSDFVDGTLVTTDIPASAADGDSFIIEISGKSYNDSTPPFKVIAQGYLYQNAIIAKSGISYGGDFATSIKMFEEGGVLKFWWPRITYWNAFEVRVVAMNGPSNDNLNRNRVTAIANSTEPTGTKKVTVNLVRSLREDAWINGKYFGSDSTIHGGQFYDNSNTAWFLDASATGNSLNVAGSLQAAGNLILTNGANRFVQLSSSTNYNYTLQAVGDDFQIREAGTTPRLTISYPTGNVTASAEVRATIFRDSNNGNFYVDPAGGSVLGGQVSFAGGTYIATNGDVYSRRTNEATGVYYFGDGGSKYLYWDGSGYLFGSQGPVSNAVAFYGPVFYDNNDSSYRTDPTGTSILNQLTLGGRNMRSFESNSYIEFTVDGDANTYYPVLIQPSSVWYHFGNWSISRGYADTAPWDPINTGAHRGGLTLTWQWSGDTNWGGNDKSYRIIQFAEQYTTIVGGMTLSVNGMIVWLRGGGAAYRLHGPAGMTNSVAVNLTTYTAGNGSTFAPRSWSQTNINNEINARFPIRNSGLGGELWDGGTRVLSDDRWINSKYFGSNGAIHGGIFYDSSNAAYYLDADSNSNLYSLTLSGGTYFQPNSWIQFNGSYGLYWPNNNGAHIEANVTGSYSPIGLRGNRNGYGGIYDLLSGVNVMFDGAGNGGPYREANGLWYQYFNVANNCTGFSTSTTFSGYNIYTPAGIKSGGRVDATIFYDASDAAFYLDPNATGTSLNVAGSIVAAGNVTAYSDVRVKDNIETVPDALIRLRAIRGVTYTRTDLEDKERRYAGVIAQEIEKALPEAVFGDEQKRVDYNGTIALLIEAVKELKAELDELKAQTCH